MSKYFKPSELECKCGCGLNLSKESTLALLDTAREKAGIPFSISSGTRCASRNRSVGGESKSSHMTGYAVDITVTDSVSRYKVIKALLEAGFTRIGIAKTFIHADNDPDKPKNVIWEY